MELNTEALRADLTRYHEMASAIGLPKGTGKPEEIPEADEARLVDIAATLGWDFAKYLNESKKGF